MAEPLAALEDVEGMLKALSKETGVWGFRAMEQLEQISRNLIPEAANLFPQEQRQSKSTRNKKSKSVKKKAGDKNASFRSVLKMRLTQAGWGLDGERLAALEQRIAMSLSLADNSQLEDVGEDGDGSGGAIKKWPWYRRTFPKITRHPLFYLILISIYAAVFMAFAVNGLKANGKLGGLFGTFLGIPPQYSTDENLLLNIPIQKQLLPILYGVMHCVLLSLGLLPLGMCRGFARDLSRKFPSLARKWYGLPVDEIEHLHRLWGWLSIGGLLVGCFLWLIMYVLLRVHIFIFLSFSPTPSSIFEFETANLF